MLLADFVELRLTYIMCHQVNKQMGCTILMDVALEITVAHSPWESGQVVVALSRTKFCNQITIVSDYTTKRDTVLAMWKCLCKVTQWTAMIENLIDKLSVTARGTGGDNSQSMCINMVEHFPMRVCDYSLPLSNTGYVYMLLSSVCHTEVYIGQTGRNIAVRLAEHNSGKGAVQTAVRAFMPWGVAAYIDKLSHMSESERLSLEHEWKMENHQLRHNGFCDVQGILDNGATIVRKHNALQTEPEKMISFHVCIQYKKNQTQ